MCVALKMKNIVKHSGVCIAGLLKQQHLLAWSISTFYGYAMQTCSPNLVADADCLD